MVHEESKGLGLCFLCEHGWEIWRGVPGNVYMVTLRINIEPPGGVLPEKFGRGVRPASQNPYPIYDQNLRFSLPYLWPDQKFDTLFMTWLLDH